MKRLDITVNVPRLAGAITIFLLAIKAGSGWAETLLLVVLAWVAICLVEMD